MTAPAAGEQPRGEMPFLEHLEELRWRLVKSLVAIAIGIGFGYFAVTNWDVIALLKRPMDPFLGADRKLLFTSLMEPFILQLKLAFAIGGALALPVVLYQVWGFLRPALYPKEQRVIFPMIFVAMLLFAGGMAIGYYIVMPMSIPVLMGFATESLAPMLTADKYFGFAIAVVLAFGAVFEMPLIMFMLIYMRIISSAFLRKHHRTFLIVNAIASSILTPGDLIVMTLITMVPIQLFYELGIVMAMMMERKRARAEAAEERERGSGGIPAAGAA
jgi:sec-independent protein translocase protein TatC